MHSLFASAFFSGKKIGVFDQGEIAIFSLYALGIIVAILVGKFFSEKVFKGEESYFILELPPYRIPTAKSIFIHMWEKSSHFQHLGYIQKDSINKASLGCNCSCGSCSTKGSSCCSNHNIDISLWTITEKGRRAL